MSLIFFPVNDATKYLNTLRSPTVSLIKKRQLMNNLFGDYRTKMKREESNNNESNKKGQNDLIKLSEITKKILRKAFI